MSIVLPPNLIVEFNSAKNPNVNECFTTSKVWWVCKKGHEWQAQISNRINGTGCPYCSNRKVLKGFNDLVSQAPHIAQEWDLNKNIDSTGKILKPDEIVYGSSYKAWWLCSKGHEWQATLDSRFNRKTGCPFCSGVKSFQGQTDLATRNPELAKQWHPNRNGKLLPNDVSPMSSKKVWWLGECGHEWEAVISKRNGLARGCIFCSNQSVLPGFNDLATTHPELASQWSYSKNSKITPSQVIAGGKNKFWWECNKGHTWEATINKRKMGSNCPYCSGQKTLSGFNDLSTRNTYIANQWHPTKNGNLSPDNLTAGADRKVWWLGECGHEWEALVRERAGSHNTGCPKCPTLSSKAEKEIGLYVKSLLPKSLIEYGVKNVIDKTELDIYLPEHNIAIEYNGLYWHSENVRKDKNYHYNKWLACKEQGIQLIQIWEDSWMNEQKIVKNMLANKLSVSSQDRIYARNTVVKNINKIEIESFLDKNHIQGNVNGGLRYGLFEKTSGNLVAVICFKKEGTNLNLIRYATSAQVIGGFTKLIKHVERTNKNIKSITTFSDNMVSDGSLYLNSGFVQDKIIAPDYMYVYKNVRWHKFSFRLKRFKKDSNFKYESGLTEKELAELNNIRRVWDAGKIKWKLSIN